MIRQESHWRGWSAWLVLVCAGVRLLAGPDLVVTDVWNDGGVVHYQVRNIGDKGCASGHVARLTVNGFYAMSDWNVPALEPGERLDRVFTKYTWQCGEPADTIAVTVDFDDVITEDDETNNRRSEIWRCDTSGPRITEGPSVDQIGTSRVKITWKTDETSDSAVLMGRKAATEDMVFEDAGLGADHEIWAEGLDAGVTYHFRVRSRDAAGNSVFSRTQYVTTGVKPDGAGPKIGTEQVRAMQVPMEFMVPVGDSSGVEYVRFYLDGRLVETDYSEPFLCSLIPDELGLAPGAFYAGHTLAVEARDQGGELSVLPVYVEPLDLCWPAELDFEFPYEGYTIYIDGATVPAGHDPLWVRLRASATPWREVVRFGEVIEMGEPIDRIEIRVDDHPVHVETDATEVAHPIPIDGWSRGDYDVKVTLIEEGCIPVSCTRTVHIERARPELTLESRRVTRDGNVLTVSLQFYNGGPVDAFIMEVEDRITGFQVLPSNDGKLGFWPDVTGRDTRVVWNDPAGQRVRSLHRWTLDYQVIPALYLGFDDYAMGEEDTRVVYEDEHGRGNAVTFYEPAGSTSLRNLVDEACAGSDYLIVTSPRQVVRHANEAGWRGLARVIARLALARNAILGYYDGSTVLATAFDSNDKIGVGGIFGCPDREEVVVADEEEDVIRVYSLHSSDIDEDVALPIAHEGLSEQDVLVVGNVQGHAGMAVHPEDEIVVIDGHSSGSSLGRATVYKYFRDHHEIVPYYYNTRYEPGDAVAVGDVVHTPDWPTDELVIAHPDGTIDVYANSLSERTDFDSVFDDGDLLAVGDVMDDAHEEIIVGDVSHDRLVIYAGDGDELTRFDLPGGHGLSESDQLIVRDVLGGSGAEIVIVDDSEDRVTVYRYYPGVGALMELSSFALPYHPDDEVLLGNPMGLAKNQLIHACGTRRNQRNRGDLEIAPFSEEAEAPGDRHTLDGLLECDGAWAQRMAPGWCDGGYLLIVGETRIIPAFSAKYGSVGKGDKVIEYTDNFYANTSGHEKWPELCVGRIIGNEPERLATPIEATLGILDGTRDFDQSHALIVSGRPRGASGEATTINFNRERNRIERRIDDNWSHTRELDEPSETEWIDAMVGRDVIHLAAHGWENGMDVLHDETVRDTWDPGVTAPLVYANSCLTGRYPPTRCLGERFLNHGASAYIGATEVSYSPYCRYLAEGFWDRFDVGYTAGRALKEAKRNRMGDGSYAKYNSAIYHLFGDPKLEPVVGPPSEGTDDGAVPPPADVIEGPVSSVQVKVPMYVVETEDGETEAHIPGGDMVLEPDRPMVPCYMVQVRFPAGYGVQDVGIDERSNLRTDTLNLPIAELAEYGLQTPPPAPEAEEGWFPENDLDWWTIREPDGGTTLMIRVHAFQYEATTGHVRFWDTYDLNIEYVATDMRIRRLAVESGVVLPGEMVRWDLAVENKGKVPTDVLVEAVVRTPDEAPLAGLPIRRLRDVRGLATLSQEWDSAGCEPNFLSIEVTLRSLDGAELDRQTAAVMLGRAEMSLETLKVGPSCFSAGDLLKVMVQGRNTGDRATGGTMVVDVLGGHGQLLEQLTEDFEALLPDNVAAAMWKYEAPAARGAVSFRASILYEGMATEPAEWPVAAPVDGDLDDDGRVGLGDLAILAAGWLGNAPQADIAPPGGNCMVDLADLRVLAGLWLGP